MSVNTQQITWGINKGFTKVEIRMGCTDRMSFLFRTRKEAAEFLVALRKRVR